MEGKMSRGNQEDPQEKLFQVLVSSIAEGVVVSTRIKEERHEGVPQRNAASTVGDGGGLKKDVLQP